MKETICYKLTNRNHCTRNKTKWGPGVTNTAKQDWMTGDKLGQGPLCSSSWIHAFIHPLQAYSQTSVWDAPRPWHFYLCIGYGKMRAENDKIGFVTLKTVKEIKYGKISYKKWNALEAEYKKLSGRNLAFYHIVNKAFVPHSSSKPQTTKLARQAVQKIFGKIKWPSIKYGINN